MQARLRRDGQHVLEIAAPVGRSEFVADLYPDLGNLASEVRQAVLLARLRAALLGRDDAARALDGRQAWRLAWAGGAACLGR